MYILYLFEAVYIAHDISLGKKGLECMLLLKNVNVVLVAHRITSTER
jgi:hypothetical protein